MTTAGRAPGDVHATDDGRYVVIDGRRWRATDPSIPPAFAAELRKALMAARRDVGVATRSGEDPSPARARVHDVKVALGERGAPWWEPGTDDTRRTRIAATARCLAIAREPKTACPSDVARSAGGTAWRSMMPLVREVVGELASAGELVVTQKGRPVQPPWHGPIRFRRPTSA